jgi:hypothetical protein
VTIGGGVGAVGHCGNGALRETLAKGVTHSAPRGCTVTPTVEVVTMRRLRIVSVAVVVALTMLVPAGGAAARERAAPAASVLREIRAAHHRGYDRLVFEFSGPLPSRTRVRWVDQVIADGSGLPVRVAGNAKLAVELYPAHGHTLTGDIHRTYGPRRRAYDLPNIATVVNSGDFEAYLTFGVGVIKRTSIVRTMRLRNPSRYVIDIGTRFRRRRVKTWMFDAQRFVDNTPPFFRPVRRSVPRWAPARGALHRVYAGPTQAERADGLRLLRSRSTGFANLRISRTRIARVQLTGRCGSGGSTVTVAGHITPTLKQFRSVRWVKIYDPQGTTERPWGRSDSIPECLEP